LSLAAINPVANIRLILELAAKTMLAEEEF
jgi:hypothetical protein